MLRTTLLAASLAVLAACSSGAPTSSIADGAVTTLTLADGSVTSAKLAQHAVEARALADGAVGTAQLAATSVTNAQLADGSVDGRTLASGAVGTAQLTPGAVGTAQLAPGSVGTAQLAPGSVGTAQLATGAAVLGLNGLSGSVTLAGSANIAVTSAGNVLTLGLQGPIDAATVGGLAPGSLLRLDGSQTLTGVPTFGATGSPPFAVASASLVPNLNAERVGGVPASALARKVNNVLQVAMTGGDFTSIQAAIDSVTDASPSNRYLIRIAPGSYPERLVLQANIVLQGAGQDLTIIQPPGQPSNVGDGAVVMQDADELRDLTVIGSDTDSGFYAVGVNIAAGASSAVLRDVRISVSGGSQNMGIYTAANAAITLDRVEVRVSAPVNAVALGYEGTQAVIARSSILAAQGGSVSTSTSFVSTSGGPAFFVNTQLDGQLQGTPTTCVGSYSGSYAPLNGACL